MTKPVVVIVALGIGVLAGAGGAVLLREPLPKPAPPPAVADASDDDDDALMTANANLVSSLQECNRRLAEAGQKRVATPPAPAPSAVASGRTRSQTRRDLTAADWQRFATEGAVPYNVPCIRDTPFVPSPQQLDRLGLAPQDADVLRDAYAKSNERIVAQLTPLCSQVLGSEQLAARLGPKTCMNAVIDSSRRQDADKMQQALTRVAEVQAGTRPQPSSGQPLEAVEALMLALTSESKAFEADLASRLGPDDAHRIATARGLCSERGVVRAKPDSGNERTNN